MHQIGESNTNDVESLNVSYLDCNRFILHTWRFPTKTLILHLLVYTSMDNFLTFYRWKIFDIGNQIAVLDTRMHLLNNPHFGCLFKKVSNQGVFVGSCHVNRNAYYCSMNMHYNDNI